MKAWWQHEPEGGSTEFPYFYHGWFIKNITTYQSHTGECIHRKTYSGTVSNPNEFVAKLKEAGGKELYKSIRTSGIINDCFIAWDTTLVSIGSGVPNHIYYMSIISTDSELTERILGIARTHMQTEAQKGSIYSLVVNGKTLDLIPIGLAAMDIQSENYDPNVIKDMKHVVEDLKKNDPCGKFIILDGPPGTGKTSLIKGIVGLLDATFILVQAHTVVEWAGPDMVTLLTQKKSELKTPLIFIIEDADECIVPRQEGNMNTLSTLLNLSDGILSGIFDIRIIATTNINLSEIDKALIRSMRLCRRISIGPLDKDSANNVYKKISEKDEDPFTEPTILADIYKTCKDPDRRTQEKKPSKIGFANC